MHEGFIAQGIIDKAKEQGIVKKIVVEVGDLGHLPAKEMKAKLEEMVDWEVEVIEVPALVECKCGYRGKPKILEKAHDLTLFECPQCGKIPFKIISGEEIVLKDVVVE
ncbi:hydrogenase maturation nickel metallochaperone HypA [Candidatus Woesearchaeota archaeon]|nr:hydrogenase maturation nickel metallochaperone HypA [Candidatus Woesearchaeota archaeon]